MSDEPRLRLIDSQAARIADLTTEITTLTTEADGNKARIDIYLHELECRNDSIAALERLLAAKDEAIQASYSKLGDPLVGRLEVLQMLKAALDLKAE